MKAFSAHSRSSVFQTCQEKNPDLIIIGGGITGAGILLEASRRGLNVVLVEQNDFASGTSSVSSKLIHGGLRYLETMNLGLVFESTHERKRLLELAPDLVKPLEFLVPVYKGQRRGLFTILAGTWLYYFLALFHNIGRPRFHGQKCTLALESNLASKNLRGSVGYFDAGTLDSRLTLSTIKTAWSMGGLAVNHAKVINYIHEKNRIAGVVVQDQISGKTHEIRAQWTINALGPWTDEMRKNTVANASETLRLTKGAHVLVSRNPFSIQHAILMISPLDGRVVFLIPWCGHTLIGTTDEDYRGSTQDVRVEKSDIEYLVKTAAHYFPTIHLHRDQIMTTFVGLRCLKRESDIHPSNVTREHVLFSDKPGLMTIAGGKLTTYLSMAEDAMNWICDRESSWKTIPKQHLQKLDDVLTLEQMKIPSAQIFQTLIENEMAVTIRDLLQYRTLSYYLTKDHGSSLIDLAGRAIKASFQLSDEAIEQQIVEYKREIDKQNIQHEVFDSGF